MAIFNSYVKLPEGTLLKLASLESREMGLGSEPLELGPLCPG
jgi:hypothetical protein